MNVRLKVPVLFLVGLFAAQDPSIRFVPRIVDRHFAERQRLCEGDATSTDLPVSNDERRSVQDFLGPALRELQVHQVGDSLAVLSMAGRQIRTLLRARPRSFTRFPTWAEGTPFRTWGVLGTVHYASGRAGRVEAVGNHLCIADSSGMTWWLRLEVVDVWPDSS